MTPLDSQDLLQELYVRKVLLDRKKNQALHTRWIGIKLFRIFFILDKYYKLRNEFFSFNIITRYQENLEINRTIREIDSFIRTLQRIQEFHKKNYCGLARCLM